MFALLFDENHLLLKLWLRFTRNIPPHWQLQRRELGSDEKHRGGAAAAAILSSYTCRNLFFFPFLNVTRLSADSHGAFSSSADQKRLLLPSSVPLTYWYLVTFEFHNCSTTFIMARFKQRCHEALQHFLRCVSVNESCWCVTVCSELFRDLLNYNKLFFFSLLHLPDNDKQ